MVPALDQDAQETESEKWHYSCGFTLLVLLGEVPAPDSEQQTS
jgi:hypothetical protein